MALDRRVDSPAAIRFSPRSRTGMDNRRCGMPRRVVMIPGARNLITDVPGLAVGQA